MSNSTRPRTAILVYSGNKEIPVVYSSIKKVFDNLSPITDYNTSKIISYESFRKKVTYDIHFWGSDSERDIKIIKTHMIV